MLEDFPSPVGNPLGGLMQVPLTGEEKSFIFYKPVPIS